MYQSSHVPPPTQATGKAEGVGCGEHEHDGVITFDVKITEALSGRARRCSGLSGDSHHNAALGMCEKVPGQMSGNTQLVGPHTATCRRAVANHKNADGTGSGNDDLGWSCRVAPFVLFMRPGLEPSPK